MQMITYLDIIYPCFFTIFRSVILALSKKVDKGSAPKAEAVLHKMCQIKDPQISPDTSLYHMVIHMYSKNRDVNAPQRAEALLNEMHVAFVNGNIFVKPNTITFNTVINTYAKSISQGSADRAEYILQRMQDLYHHGNPDVEPDTVTFNSVINAHANTRAGGSAIRGFAILNKMNELYQNGSIKNGKPNTRTYNACLKACYYSSDVASKEESAQNFDMAYTLLWQIHNYADLQADEYSYIWFFKAYQSNYCEETKGYQVLQEAFNMCHEDGLFSKRVLKEVHLIIRHGKY